MLTGLEEPFAKRTVEGDLGMRYSSLGILQSMTPSDIAHYGHQQLDIEKECIHRHEHVDFIPESDHDFIVEDVLAKRCIDVAVKRHVGHLTSVYTPMGMMYHQTGKDLTNVSSFIGTGGAVIAHRDPKTLLQEALSSDQKAMELRPKHPDYYIDQDYILSAMGLLSIDYPMIALRIMKKRIIKL
jgi:uncharacterized protein (TIGR01319 family)